MSTRLRIPIIALLACFFIAAPAFPQEGKMKLTKIAQVAVKTKDLQRATEFYRDKLGLKVLISSKIISVLECGDITLLLGPNETGSLIYFDVDDIHKTVEAMSAQGIRIEEKPNLVGQLGNLDVWIAAFKDSEDNVVGLMSKKPR
jgi:methylmalonyl-CoA/ethylmalonyl-CoA epimerase